MKAPRYKNGARSIRVVSRIIQICVVLPDIVQLFNRVIVQCSLAFQVVFNRCFSCIVALAVEHDFAVNLVDLVKSHLNFGLFVRNPALSNEVLKGCLHHVEPVLLPMLDPRANEILAMLLIVYGLPPSA